MLVTCWDFSKKNTLDFVSAVRTRRLQKVSRADRAADSQLDFTRSWNQYGGHLCFGAESICPLEFQDSPNLLLPPPHPPTLNVNCKTADTVTRESRLRMFRNFLLKSYYSHSYNAVIGDCWFWFFFRQVYWISAPTVLWEYDIDLSK